MNVADIDKMNEVEVKAKLFDLQQLQQALHKRLQQIFTELKKE